MKHAGLTKQERSFIALMRVWAVVFFAAGAIFALAPDYLTDYIANIGSGLLNWHSPELRIGENKFWLVLAVTLLFALSYTSAISQRNTLRNIGYSRVVIFAKLVSSIGFGVCFFISDRHFVYLVASVTDGIIFVVTWYFYACALKSRA